MQKEVSFLSSLISLIFPFYLLRVSGKKDAELFSHRFFFLIFKKYEKLKRRCKIFWFHPLSFTRSFKSHLSIFIFPSIYVLLISWQWFFFYNSMGLVLMWWNGYQCSTISFNQVWTHILRRFKLCLGRVKDLRWWESLTMVPTGSKAKRLSWVNHTTKTIHHRHHHHQLLPLSCSVTSLGPLFILMNE